MTVPLDTRNDIRSMDADGVPRAEIARRLRVSRNTVAKYADMEDMSPAAPVPARRERPALGDEAGWVESVLEADFGAPRKQRHTAKRIYDRLVSERGWEGSYSTVRRFVREWRLARGAGSGEGCLELEWPPGTCRADFGNFRAVVAGEELAPELLVATLPHPDDRQCVAPGSQRSECLCAGLAAVFSRWGRAPRVLVPGDATEAGGMVRGEVTESGLFSLFRGHYRVESRYRDPYSGNEKGSVENAVGYLRRNLLVPVPRVGSLAELNALLAEGCARLNAAAGCRDGRASAEALREDLAEMRALPGAAFDAVRWARARADKRGCVEVDGREYVAGPAWHGRELLVGMRPDSVEIVADRGRRVAVLPRAYGDGPAVRNPPSLVPAIVAGPRAFGESTIRRDMPEGLVEGIDRMDAAGRRQTLRSIARASAASGFDAACRAALRVVEGGRVPDDATVDVLARRIAAGEGGRGGADLSVYDALARRGAADGGWRRAVAPGGRGGQGVLARHGGARGVVAPGHAQAGRVPGGLPRGGEGRPGGVEAGGAAEALRAARSQDLRRLRLVGSLLAGGHGQGVAALAVLPGAPRGPRARGRRRHGQDAHGVGALLARVREAPGGPLLHGLLPRDASQEGAGRGASGQGGLPDRAREPARDRRARVPAAGPGRRQAAVPGLRGRLRAAVGGHHDQPGVQPLGGPCSGTTRWRLPSSTASSTTGAWSSSGASRTA